MRAFLRCVFVSMIGYVGLINAMDINPNNMAIGSNALEELPLASIGNVDVEEVSLGEIKSKADNALGGVVEPILEEGSGVISVLPGEIALGPKKNICSLVVMGCAKSGTLFTTTLLQKSGYDINHERYGRDGSVSWPMVANWYYPEEEQEAQEAFSHAFHQVRHPLAVISSLVSGFTDWSTPGGIPWFNTASWLFVRERVPEITETDSFVVFAAKYWYYWNLLAEKRSEWRYQIESFKEIVPEFERRSGLKIDMDQLNIIPTDCNSWLRGRKKLTWADLRDHVSDDLYGKIQEMASRYGYTLQDFNDPFELEAQPGK